MRWNDAGWIACEEMKWVCLCSDRPRNILREPEVQVRENSVLISGLLLFRGRYRESQSTSRELNGFATKDAMGDFRLHCQQNTSMDLFIPEPMTFTGWWVEGMKHSPVLTQSHDVKLCGMFSPQMEGTYSDGAFRLEAMLNGLDLLIAALNELSGDCSQVTGQSSGTMIRSSGEVQFGSGSGGGVVVTRNGILGADYPNSIHGDRLSPSCILQFP
jgi:hypothetical protein